MWGIGWSSLHSACVRSHGCALARGARSGSELLGPSSVTHSALYTFIVTQCIVYGYKRCALAGKPKFPRLVGIWGGILSRRSPNWSQAGDSNIPATRKHSCDLETRNMMTGRGEGNAPRSRTYVGALWNEMQMLSIQLFERNWRNMSFKRALYTAAQTGRNELTDVQSRYTGKNDRGGGGPLAVSLTDPVYFVALAFCSLKVSTAFFLHLIPKKVELLQIHYLWTNSLS